MHEDTRSLAGVAPLVGAATYAVVGVATLWGPAPGTWLAALAGGGRVHGVAALVVSVLELFGAVALFDTDVAAPSSAVLSLLTLGAIAASAMLGVPVAGAAVLFVAASLVAWTTRDARRAPRVVAGGERP
jgi:hypothetical protein